jgi:hypothetical protein
MLVGDDCSESVSILVLVNLNLISDCCQSLKDPRIKLPKLNIFLFLCLSDQNLDLIFGRFNIARSSLFILKFKILLCPLGSLNPFAPFAAIAFSTRSRLLGLSMLVLDFLLKLLLVIILKAGEKFGFQGSIVANLILSLMLPA